MRAAFREEFVWWFPVVWWRPNTAFVIGFFVVTLKPPAGGTFGVRSPTFRLADRRYGDSGIELERPFTKRDVAPRSRHEPLIVKVRLRVGSGESRSAATGGNLFRDGLVRVHLVVRCPSRSQKRFHLFVLGFGKPSQHGCVLLHCCVDRHIRSRLRRNGPQQFPLAFFR